jgi:hypothetical protein
MEVKPDGARPNSEAAAQRRWLITIAITILFGTFGAVMTYLSYAKDAKPSSRSNATSGVPSAAPAAAPAEKPAAAEPSSDDGDKGKHDNGKDDKDK